MIYAGGYNYAVLLIASHNVYTQLDTLQSGPLDTLRLCSWLNLTDQVSHPYKKGKKTTYISRYHLKSIGKLSDSGPKRFPEFKRLLT